MPAITFAFDKQTSRSLDQDGRMRVKNCILSTAEVNPYPGREVVDYQRLGLDADHVYSLYRTPEALRASVPSFEGVPLMVRHIPQTAQNPRKEYIGGTVHNVSFDGKHLRGDLLVFDQYAIDLIESDTASDLSCGYRYKPIMRTGAVDGVTYDGLMDNIEGNHVALVDDGRASNAHVADRAMRGRRHLVNFGADAMSGEDLERRESERAREREYRDTERGIERDAAPGSPEGEENEEMNMSAIGRYMKDIGEYMRNMSTILHDIHGRYSEGERHERHPEDRARDRRHEEDRARDRRHEEDRAHDREHEEDRARDRRHEEDRAHDREHEEDRARDRRHEEDRARDRRHEEDRAHDRRHEEDRARDRRHEEDRARDFRLEPAIGERHEGAMDSRSIQRVVDAAVREGVLRERDRVRAIDEARREVRGVLGDVHGMDSAQHIYREALAQVGIDPKSIPAGTEAMAWKAYKVALGAALGARQQPLAMDASSRRTTSDGLIEKLNKISIKG